MNLSLSCRNTITDSNSTSNTHSYILARHTIAMSNRDAFADRLMALLDEKLPGATQVQRSKSLGISQAMLSQILAGDRLVSMDKAITFATVLDVRLEWLMTGRGPKSDKDATLDYLDISDLPEPSKVALRAAADAVREQSAEYRPNAKKAG